MADKKKADGAGKPKVSRKWSTGRRLKWALRKVVLPVWLAATALSVAYGIVDGDWRPLFWCGYALYADFIFAL